MFSHRVFRCMPKIPVFRRYNSGECSKDILAQLEVGYKNLVCSDSGSLLKKHLTKSIFNSLKEKVTPTYRSTLLDCIKSGLCNHDSLVGIYAPDPEAYCTFADIFNPIIEDYHKGFKKGSKQPATCFGYGSDFPDLDPEKKFIVSTRVRCARSIEDYPFNPCLTECDYSELEDLIIKSLQTLCGEHSGEYMPLCGMDQCAQKELVDSRMLFKEGDRFLDSANALRFWPLGRGIFIGKKKNFLVWVNEEDHLRIISLQKGGDLGQVYERMIIGVESLAHTLKFSKDDHLGHLTFCPTNLGNTIRASVHIRLPKLAEDLPRLVDIANKHNLQVRGTRGEHSDVEDCVYDISNKRRMGLTEYQTIDEVHKGVTALIDAECKLSNKKT